MVPAALESDRGALTDELRTGPADFDDFWRELHAAARSVDPALRRVRDLGHADGWRTSEVRLTSTGDVEIGGFLVEPDGGADRAVVSLPGYGGADGPAGMRVPGVAELTVVPRGIPTVSEQPGVPSQAQGHVLHGIGTRETYIIGGCVQDAWVAVSAARELTGGPVDLVGISFGGGIGALALPWDERITSGALRVPTFGNHPARLRTPCTGSGEAVRLLAQSDPSVIERLRYFDAATAATRIRVPVLVGAARVDPAVPPVGQFAIYEALPGDKMLVECYAGHLEYAGVQRDDLVYEHAVRAWFAAAESTRMS